MTQTPQKHPLVAYFEAKGFMRRKQFAVIIFSLFAFTLITQLYVAQNLAASGVNVKELDTLPMPLWAHVVLFIATLATLPAVMMRARDAGWPALAFGGLFAFNIVLGILSVFIGAAIPSILGFVVQGLVLVALLGLLLKPSDG